MDHDLVLRAQAGDHDAFSALATGSIARLYRTAMLVLHDGEQARDATQDALVRAWLDIRSSGTPGASTRGSIGSHRGCYEESARIRRRRSVEIRVDDINLPVDAGDGHRVDARDRVDSAFRRLTTDQRAVLVIHHYLGLRDAEAADVLGIPAGTYKSRLHRATAAFRAAIEANDRVIAESAESLA